MSSNPPESVGLPLSAIKPAEHLSPSNLSTSSTEVQRVKSKSVDPRVHDLDIDEIYGEDMDDQIQEPSSRGNSPACVPPLPVEVDVVSAAIAMIDDCMQERLYTLKEQTVMSSIEAVIVTLGTDGKPSKKSATVSVDRIGATTREGVRLSASIFRPGTFRETQTNLLLCRELPANLRPAVSYCPLSAQTCPATRALFLTLLPAAAAPAGASAATSAAVSSDESEMSEGERQARKLRKVVGALKTIPGAILKQVETYPKLTVLVKRLRRVEEESGISWGKLVPDSGKVREILDTATSLEAWEAVCASANYSTKALQCLERSLREHLPVKFLKSFPGFMLLRRRRKLAQKAGTSESTSSALALTQQWIQFVKSDFTGEVPSSLPVRCPRPTAPPSHWLCASRGSASADWRLTVDSESEAAAQSFSEMDLVLKPGDSPLPSGAPTGFYILVFLSRLPPALITTHPVYPLIKFLIPLVSEALTVDQRLRVLGRPGSLRTSLKILRFVGVPLDTSGLKKDELFRLVASCVLRLAEGQASAADQLSPSQSAALLKYLQSAGASDSLRRSVSIRSLPARAAAARTAASVLRLVSETAEAAVHSPVVRELHLRLWNIQRWQSQGIQFLELADFSNWRQADDDNLVAAALRRIETHALRLLHGCPPELRRSSERKSIVTQLQSVRWLLLSFDLLDSALPVFQVSKVHLKHIPAPSLRDTEVFSELTSRVAECARELQTLGGNHRQFASENELEQFANLRELAGFDVTGSAEVVQAQGLLSRLEIFCSKVNYSASLANEIEDLKGAFTELEAVVRVPEPMRAKWVACVWQQQIGKALSDQPRDHSAIRQLLQEQLIDQIAVDKDRVDLDELRAWDAQVSLLVQRISDEGSFELLAEVRALGATSPQIEQLALFRDRLGELQTALRSLNAPTLTELGRLVNAVGELKAAWIGHTCPRELDALDQESCRIHLTATALEAEATAALADPSNHSLADAQQLLDRCIASHRSSAVSELAAQVEMDAALASQARSADLADFQTLLEVVQGLAETSRFRQNEALLSRSRERLWIATVSFLAKWAAAPRTVAPGPPWLILLELKSLTPSVNASPFPQLEQSVAWLVKSLQAAERILKEVKPLPADAAAASGAIPDRLGKWLRLRLLLPLYPVGLGEPMEQMRGLLEQKFPGYRLACGYLPAAGQPATHQRRLESTSLTLPGGRPGAKVSTRPGRSMMELADCDKLSSAFKQKVAGQATAPTAEGLASRALKLASRIPGLMKAIAESNGRTVTTAAEILSSDYALPSAFQGDADEWLRLGSVSGIEASLSCGSEDASRIEEMMLLEIPQVSRADYAAYLDRLIRTLLHVQSTGNADRILAKQRSSVLGDLEAAQSAKLPQPEPRALPVVAQPPRQASREKCIWSGKIVGSLRGNPFELEAALLPLFAQEYGSPQALETGATWKYDGSMSQAKFREFLPKLLSSGKRSLFDVLICATDWGASPEFFSSLVGAESHASAFLLSSSAPGAKVPKLWILPPAPGAAFVSGVLETGLVPGLPVRNLRGDALTLWVSQLEQAAQSGQIPGVAASSVYSHNIAQSQSAVEEEAPVSPAFSDQPEDEAGAQGDTQAMVDIMMQLHRELSGSVPAVETPQPLPQAVAPPPASSEFEIAAASLREALRSRPAAQTHSQQQPQAYQPPALPVVSSGLPGVLGFFSAPSTGPAQPGYLSEVTGGTVVCRFYNQGGCNRGAMCKFQHACTICRGPHPAFDHDRAVTMQPSVHQQQPQQQPQHPSVVPRSSWRHL